MRAPVLLVLACVALAAALGTPPAGAASPLPSSSSQPTAVNVASLSVWTSLGGTPGVYLYVPVNSTGVLAYPTWHVDMTSSTNASYVIYVAALKVASGTVLGTAEALFNVTGTTATVTVGFAGHTYQFLNEIIASESVQTPPPPPPLQFTAQQLAAALAAIQIQVYIVVLLAFFGSFFMARKIVILNSRSTVKQVL